MLAYVLVIAAVFILAVLLRAIGEEHPGNGYEHHQQDEPRDGEGDGPDLTAEAAA